MTIPHQQACPIAASLNQLGDVWTLLIVREASRDVSRFGDFRKNTGIAKNLLAQRLTQMVEHGILEKHDVGNFGTRFEYQLSAKGKALMPMMATMIQWGNEWVFGPGNEPVKMISRKTGASITSVLPSDSEGIVFAWDDVTVRYRPRAGQHPKEADLAQEQSR
jgi:DNA-binding HxlR family transcriptional regulator